MFIGRFILNRVGCFGPKQRAQPLQRASGAHPANMDASMDIDMDLDLGPLPEPEPEPIAAVCMNNVLIRSFPLENVFLIQYYLILLGIPTRGDGSYGRCT